MNKSSTPASSGLFLTFFSLILIAFVVFLALTDRKFLWVTSIRSAVITVGVIGMALCSRGIGRVAAASAWTHPLSIMSYLVGAAILVITVLAGLNISIPIISSARNALLVIIALIGIKYVISITHMVILSRK